MTHTENDNIIILMVEKVYRFIKQNNMFDGCNNIIAGISGGADSVCLMLVLTRIIKLGRYPIKLTGVHVNHGIRGEEASRDERFAMDFCKGLGVECKTVHIDIPKLVKEQGLSEEEAGRIERYRIFNEVAASMQGNSRIAVAHHMNDQAETVLMNMFRGSSLAGISGIKPVRDNIIRPLLCVDRQQIESFLKECAQDYITDSTNLDNDYTRNKLRNTLIPFIQNNINRQAPQHICMAAQDISEAEEYISAQADRLYNERVTVEYDSTGNVTGADIDISGDCDRFLLRYVIRRVIGMIAGRLKDVYKTHIMAVVSLADMQTGRQIDMPYSIIAKRKYNCISMYKRQVNSDNNNEYIYNNNTDGNGTVYDIQSAGICENKKSSSLTAAFNGAYDTHTADGKSGLQYDCIEKDRLVRLTLGDTITVDINDYCYIHGSKMTFIEKITFDRVLTLEKNGNNSYTIYFDCDRLDSVLVIRNKTVGDYIRVNVDGRSKKLKKELVDRKVPSEYRQNVLLLADGNDILWMCGIRRGESARVDKESSHIIRAVISTQ